MAAEDSRLTFYGHHNSCTVSLTNCILIFYNALRLYKDIDRLRNYSTSPQLFPEAFLEFELFVEGRKQNIRSCKGKKQHQGRIREIKRSASSLRAAILIF